MSDEVRSNNQPWLNDRKTGDRFDVWDNNKLWLWHWADWICTYLPWSSGGSNHLKLYCKRKHEYIKHLEGCDEYHLISIYSERFSKLSPGMTIQPLPKWESSGQYLIGSHSWSGNNTRLVLSIVLPMLLDDRGWRKNWFECGNLVCSVDYLSTSEVVEESTYAHNKLVWYWRGSIQQYTI